MHHKEEILEVLVNGKSPAQLHKEPHETELI